MHCPFETVSTEKLIIHIQRVLDEHRRQRHSSPPILAFDADQTLWSGDIGCDVFAAQIRQAKFHDEVRPLFEAELTSLGISHATELDTVPMARALLSEFEHGRYADAPSSVMMALAFAGYSYSELSAFAREVVESVLHERRLNAPIQQILRWASSAEVESYIVSASLKAAVEVGAERFGIPADRVIAMVPRVEDGRCVLELDGGSVYGPGKVDAIERTVQGRTLIAAFGDSAGDVYMMRRASVGVGVDPSDKLLAVASSVPSFVILRAHDRC